MMTSTQKQSRIVDYFNTKKRFTSINKDGTSLKLVDNVSSVETKEKDLLATEANILNNNLNDSPQLTNNLRSRKRRLSSANEDSNVVKRICTSELITRQPIFVSNTEEQTSKKCDLQEEKKLLNQLKRKIPILHELRNESQKKQKTLHQSLPTVPAVDNCELVLPSKYITLLDTFKTFDHLVGMLYNRSEMCFIDKLKPSVESVTRRKFTLKHLGQFVTVNPEAYNLRLEFKPTRSLYNKSGDQRHLTVNPNIPPLKGENNEKVRSYMTPIILTERKNTFKNNLLKITKSHHQKFLSSLQPPIIINDCEIRKWHVSFLLNGVPEIEPAEIPQANPINPVTTALEVLEKVRGLNCKRLEKSLEAVAADSISEQSTPTETTKITISNPQLKGIPLSLLEKVRAREAANKTANAILTMTRDSASEKKLKAEARLPQIARIVKTLFVGERKSSLRAHFVYEKIRASYIGSITDQTMKEDLEMISKLAPDWLSFIKLSNGDTYYKLRREMDLNAILKTFPQPQKLKR
ncbi:replication licensing factor Cdt1 [Chamberlinius hualienensis]